LPCELIENNGEALKKTILKYANHWDLDKAFILWINEANHFCNTLVDRIVSGYPADRAVSIQAELGYEDPLMVAGEYYHSWVIQGPEIVKEELPFIKTGLNVSFVEDLEPYREMKVRILNGAHTAMVPVAYLAGIRSVKEVMEDQELSGFVESLLLEEVAKTLDFPTPVKQQYVWDVLDRFRNPLLKHRLISIALNSSSKFVTRLLPTLKDYCTLEGKLPDRIVFALSALMLFYKGSSNNEKIDLKDDPGVLECFDSNWKRLVSGEIVIEHLVQNILENTTIWNEDMTQIPGLAGRVSTHLKNIENYGIKGALSAVNKGNITV
jgi:tagaturonate reductase